MFLVYIDGFMSSNPSWHQPNPRYQQHGVPPHVYGTNNKDTATPMAPPLMAPTLMAPTQPQVPTTTTWGAPPHFYGANNKNKGRHQWWLGGFSSFYGTNPIFMVPTLTLRHI